MRRALGYDAEALPAICEAVLQARADGALHPRQLHIAARCELIARGLMRIGIIALVDEATGYQADRARDSLARILRTDALDAAHDAGNGGWSFGSPLGGVRYCGAGRSRRSQDRHEARSLQEAGSGNFKLRHYPKLWPLDRANPTG